MRYLFSIDMPWSEWHTRASDSIGRGFCFEIVVHDIQKHGNEEQNKTACASLDTSEFVCYWSRKDREPEMILGDFVVCSLGENIGKFLFLKIMRHEQHAFDLFNRRKKSKSLDNKRTNFSIVFFHSQPSLTDEIEFLHGLQIAHDDILQKPRCWLTRTTVVMPNTKIIQVSQWSAREKFVEWTGERERRKLTWV